MNVQDLNEIANNIAVERLTIQQLEEEYANEIAKNSKLADLEQQIKEAKMRKDGEQGKLLEVMKSEQLKSWKTEQANFARTTRYSVQLDPSYKKQIENRLKEGETVEGFELHKTEYISIRSNKN